MRNLPEAIITVLRHFELVFSERVWEWATILLVGAIVAPGTRTVASVLRVMGLSQERQFQTFHRVLNRDQWSSRQLSRILLRVLVRSFVPADQAIVLGLDDHIERRRGAKIAAKGSPAENLANSFDGPTAIAYNASDPVSLAKALTAYAKTNPLFVFKAGMVEGRVVNIADLNAIASMPSKEELIAKLLFLLNSPAQRIAVALNGVARNLAVVVGQAVEQKKFKE